MEENNLPGIWRGPQQALLGEMKDSPKNKVSCTAKRWKNILTKRKRHLNTNNYLDSNANAAGETKSSAGSASTFQVPFRPPRKNNGWITWLRRAADFRCSLYILTPILRDLQPIKAHFEFGTTWDNIYCDKNGACELVFWIQGHPTRI